MKKIIIDTDMGSDCDDSGALAVVHNLITEGKCELLAVMCNIANEYSPVAVKAINTWFNRGDIPVAQTDGKLFKDTERNMIYTKHIAQEYLKNHSYPEIGDSVKLYRKILCENTDVTIVSIGFLNNIAELLSSEPDEISNLCGMDLVKKSVSKVYIMGGNFSGREQAAEYNIRMDILSAKEVAEKFPVPAVYLGWEAGVNVYTGHTLWLGDDASPVKKSYELYAAHYNCAAPDGTFDRHSWDPMTVYYAITDDTSFMHESKKCTVSFDDGGFTNVLPCGKDTYLIVDDVPKAQQVIEKYIGIKW